MPTMIEITCTHCGCIYETKLKNYNSGKKRGYKNNFCSSQCRANHLSNRVELACDQCGVKYETKLSEYNKSKNHFCSIRCSADHLKKDRVELICGNCNATYNVSEYVHKKRLALGYTNNYCSAECTKHAKATNFYKIITSSTRSNARKRKLDFDLDEKYLKYLMKKQGFKCGITGIELETDTNTSKNPRKMLSR